MNKICSLNTLLIFDKMKYDWIDVFLKLKNPKNNIFENIKDNDIKQWWIKLLCSNLIDQIWSFHLILYLQHLKVFCTLTFEMELKEYKV